MVWLNYYIQFRTLAASDPSLCWDTRHTDLWLQCVTAPSLPTIHWPCSHSGTTNIFLEIIIFAPMPYQHLLMGTDKPICQAPARDNIQLQEEHLRNFRQSTCHTFNRSVCRHQTCQFLHQCELCGTTHSAKNCPNRGSSTQ